MRDNLIPIFLAVVVALLVVQALIKRRRHEVFAYAWDHTALFIEGRFARWLDPGRHVVHAREVRTLTVDRRAQNLLAPMQEILTKDGASIRVSASAVYRVTEYEKWLLEYQDATSLLYTEVQLALRTAVGERTLVEAATDRRALSTEVERLARERAATLGVEIERLELRDLAILGELRKAVAGVLQAQLEGQAALERARAESASLRSLANSARMLDDNPNLLNLRLLQTLGENRQATVVFDPRAPVTRPSET